MPLFSNTLVDAQLNGFFAIMINKDCKTNFLNPIIPQKLKNILTGKPFFKLMVTVIGVDLIFS
jgi:hypothetical protein